MTEVSLLGGGEATEQDQKTENGAVEKADQMAWEAPALRPVFTEFGEREEWAHPCPSWCEQGPEHDVEWTATHARRHASASLRVRQDAGYAYEVVREDGIEGMEAAHIEACLTALSRNVDMPMVQMILHWGDGKDNAREFKIRPLYFDEVRELISVLQHLMKVGMDS